MKNGYAICMNEWALDKNIKNELGLLLIISSLCAEKGYCFASNKYLGELFNLPEQTISRKIKILEEKKYITIEYKKRGCEVIERYIRLTKMLTDDKQKCEPTINKNVKDNNISINNTSINKENYTKEFENFWKCYPKKKNKGQVEKWFKQHKPSKELVDQMIKQIERLKDTEQWKKDNGQFIPYPSTWLNAKGWEDEFETDTEREERIDKEIMEGIYGT